MASRQASSKSFSEKIADLNIGRLASEASLNSSWHGGAVNAVAAVFDPRKSQDCLRRTALP